jgi:hypothetical protein
MALTDYSVLNGYDNNHSHKITNSSGQKVFDDVEVGSPHRDSPAMGSLLPPATDDGFHHQPYSFLQVSIRPPLSSLSFLSIAALVWSFLPIAALVFILMWFIVKPCFVPEFAIVSL